MEVEVGRNEGLVQNWYKYDKKSFIAKCAKLKLFLQKMSWGAKIRQLKNELKSNG